jgi:hypothetical protein
MSKLVVFNIPKQAEDCIQKLKKITDFTLQKPNLKPCDGDGCGKTLTFRDVFF